MGISQIDEKTKNEQLQHLKNANGKLRVEKRRLERKIAELEEEIRKLKEEKN